MCSEQCSNCSTFCWCCTFLKGGGKWKDAACFRLNIFNNEERHMFLPEVQPQHSPSSDARKYCCFFGGGGLYQNEKSLLITQSIHHHVRAHCVFLQWKSWHLRESVQLPHKYSVYTSDHLDLNCNGAEVVLFFFFMEWFFRKKHLTSNNYFYHQFICFLIFWSVNIKK